jgi:hypothetical protein
MRRNLCPFFLLVSLFGLTVSGSNAQSDFNIQPIVQYDNNWHDQVTDVAIQNGYALLACGCEGLRIVSGFDTDSPTVVGQLTGFSLTRVVTSGNYVYGSSWWDISAGVRVIDISDPSQPREVTWVAGRSTWLRIVGDHLFMGGYSSLTMLDISDPADPQIVWQRSVGGVSDIDMVGDRAYVAACDLLVWDVSDLSSPQPLDTIRIGAPSEEAVVEGVRVSGNYAYVACGNHGLKIVDLNAGQVVSGVDSLSYAYSLQLQGSYVYLYYGPFSCPLAVIDINDPLSPKVTGIYRPPMYLGGFALQGDRAYVADFWYGLRTVDIADPYHPVEVSRYNRCGDYNDVKVVGNRAYVMSGHSLSSYRFRMQVFDIACREHPLELGGFEIPGGLDLHSTDFQMSGNICFLHRGLDGAPPLASYDLTDPAAPTLLGSITGDWLVYRIVQHDHFLYVMENEGVRIIDVADPAAMTEVGYFTGDIGNSPITVEGNYAFLTVHWGTLVALDVSNPAAPVIVDTVETCYPEGLAAAAGMLYVSTRDSLYIFDALPPHLSSPRSVTAFPMNLSYYYGSMMAADEYLFVGMDSSNFLVYDVSDPEAPFLTGRYRTPGKLRAIAVQGSMVAVADGSNLGLYDCSQALSGGPQIAVTFPSDIALLPNYPNPFNMSTRIPFELPAQSRVTVTVYDLLGRSVATLVDGEYPAGQHVLTWDGTTGRGQTVASGQYFVRLQTANKFQTRPITLLK